MERYKICPLCGTHNSPAMLECTECEADLISIAAVTNAEEKSDVPTSNAVTRSPQIVRICDCGFQNPASVRKCQQCGEDILDIMPQSVSEKVKYQLIAEPDGYTYIAKQERFIIGRKAEMSEYLEKKVFVSRTHAELYYENDVLYVQNLSHTNPTFVNSDRLNEAPHCLNDGDLLMLGGTICNGEMQPEAAYFRIRRL